MSISYLDVILNNLKTKMEDKIVAGEFYEESPTIARGITSWEDATSFPFVWFVSTNVEYTDTMSVVTEVAVDINIIGYAKTDGNGGSDKLMKLLKDVEYFLYNDYTDADDDPVFMNLLKCVISEGGISEESGQTVFSLEIKVLSNFNTGTLL